MVECQIYIPLPVQDNGTVNDAAINNWFVNQTLNEGEAILLLLEHKTHPQVGSGEVIKSDASSTFTRSSTSSRFSQSTISRMFSTTDPSSPNPTGSEGESVSDSDSSMINKGRIAECVVLAAVVVYMLYL